MGAAFNTKTIESRGRQVGHGLMLDGSSNGFNAGFEYAP